MPPSIAIATPVLGDPGTMRVVLNSSSTHPARCVFHSSSNSAATHIPSVPASEGVCTRGPARGALRRTNEWSEESEER